MNSDKLEARQADLLISLVSLATGTNRGALLLRRRGQASVAQARQIAMYLSHISLQNSLTKVGEQFGRDKSTVGHAVHLIEDLREDAAFEEWMSELETAIHAGKRVLETRCPSRAISARQQKGEDLAF